MYKFTTIIILMLACAIKHVNAQEQPKNILFLGNSFLAFNNTPNLVRDFADADALPININSRVPGGATVKHIPQGEFAHANNPAVYDLIRSQEWDYVVVQDNQGFFINPTIGSYSSEGQIIEGHSQLRDSLQMLSNRCGRIVLFSGWVDKDPMGWAPEFGMATAQIANQRVFNQYQYLNGVIGQLIAPIGMAWNYVLDEMPEVELFAADDYHPSYAGSYLTAATIYCLTFKKDPTNSTFNGSLDPVLARELRSRAYRAVMEYAEESGLNDTNTPELSLSGAHLSAPETYTAYAWYKDDSLLAGETGSAIEAESDACYRLIATGADGCRYESFPFCTGDGPTGLENVPPRLSSAILSPNPVSDRMNIDFSTAASWPESGSIIDAVGRRVHTFIIEKNSVQLDTDLLSPGVYFIYFSDGSYNKFIKE